MLRMKLDKTIKIAGCLTFLAAFALGFWSFLLSSRIEHGGVLSLSFFPDSFNPPLRTICVVLTVLAIGYTVLIVARAFCSESTRPAHLVMICVVWVLGSFALHCWVLYGLAGG